MAALFYNVCATINIRNYFACPEPENEPAIVSELLGSFIIPFYIAEDFIPPKLRVPGEFFLERGDASNRPIVTMPEVTVAKHYYLSFGENNIGSAGHFCDVHAITKPFAP
jgi:hypothetical protein